MQHANRTAAREEVAPWAHCNVAFVSSAFWAYGVACLLSVLTHDAVLADALKTRRLLLRLLLLPQRSRRGVRCAYGERQQGKLLLRLRLLLRRTRLEPHLDLFDWVVNRRRRRSSGIPAGCRRPLGGG